jgi:phosphate-selective porin OprO/OprP
VFANTGDIGGDDQQFLGLELVSVWGPWSLAAEYQSNWVQNATTLVQGNPGAVGLQPAPGTAVGTYQAHGAYLEVLYFLTGETRAYNRKTANFDRVIPNENFWIVTTPDGRCMGWGAWQVGGRYSHLDLTDAGIEGGILDSFTLGLNWFWNPNAKVQFNYDITWRDFTNDLGFNGDGQVHGFGMRMAFDF